MAIFLCFGAGIFAKCPGGLLYAVRLGTKTAEAVTNAELGEEMNLLCKFEELCAAVVVWRM